MKLFDFLARLSKRKKPSVGLALGSGGFKGAAHIGVIRALLEEGVDISFVGGTSIGALVGCLFALDYTPDEMINTFKEFSVYDVKQYLSLSVDGLGTDRFVDRILGGRHFEDTFIPFTAVATDLDSGDDVHMSTGALTPAVAASCAICPPFKPVKIGDKRLIDGAFVNSVPADAVKDMGADIVIGVPLGSYRLNDKIKAKLDGRYKNNGVVEQDRLRQLEFADVVIAPDLSNYSAASFKDFYRMYNIGYDAAKAKLSELNDTLKDFKI